MATLKEKLASQHGDSVKAAFGVGDVAPRRRAPMGTRRAGNWTASRLCGRPA